MTSCFCWYSKLAQLLPFVDAQRIGIWGWSYGGFASALALARDSAHVFRCAASVAPVTDFQLYDSIYTERFMGLPGADDNAVGYAATRVSALADQFRNRTFFLVHGTFDDNVHYQQSMLLSRSLELHDVLFRQMVSSVPRWLRLWYICLTHWFAFTELPGRGPQFGVGAAAFVSHAGAVLRRVF